MSCPDKFKLDTAENRHSSTNHKMRRNQLDMRNLYFEATHGLTESTYALVVDVLELRQVIVIAGAGSSLFNGGNRRHRQRRSKMYPLDEVI